VAALLKNKTVVGRRQFHMTLKDQQLLCQSKAESFKLIKIRACDEFDK
jgi:hypothetical protein